MPYYFPIVFLLKSTLGFLVLLLLAAIVGVIFRRRRISVIPDEVRLQLTLRSYSEEVRNHTVEAIKRITRGLAEAADLPKDRYPAVIPGNESSPATYNDPELVRRLLAAFRKTLGNDRVVNTKPIMGAEDFGLFGRTEDKIPICIFYVGGVRPEALRENEQTGKPLPSLHSPLWAPLPEPTIKGGVTAMTAAVLELTQNKQ